MRKPYWLVLLCAWCSSGQTAEPTPEIPQLQWPTDLRARLASGFGERERSGAKEFHGGIDLSVRTIAYGKDGTHTPIPVYAAESGKVVHFVTKYGERGQAVVIEHGGKFTTVYGHIDPTVKTGDTVTRGQQIGSVTKWPGNEHLHFSVHSGSFDPKNTLASTQGIYRSGTDPTKINALDPLKHTSYPKELIQDVSSKLSEAFGSKTERVARRVDLSAENEEFSSSPERIARRIDLGETEPQPEPTPPRFLPDRSLGGAKGKKERIGPIAFVLPEGWSVANRRNEGLQLGKGGVSDWRLFLNVMHHPGFLNTPYTPEEVGRTILKFSWGVDRPSRIGSTTVGRQALPVVWMAAGDTEGVFFNHAGKIYMINRMGASAKEAFQHVLQTLEITEEK